MFESRRPDILDGERPATGPVLVVGNRRTSSGSIAAWLALDAAGLEVALEEVDLFAVDIRTRLAKLSPSRRVPVLLEHGTTIWESLAIMEWCAEKAPALWPAHARRRAVARSITAELQAGFGGLRAQLPLDWHARYRLKGHPPASLQVELHRLVEIWRTQLTDAAQPTFLFGDRPSLADFAMVPMAARLRCYGLLPRDEVALGYAERLLRLEPLARWLADEPEAPALPAPPPLAAAEGEAPPAAARPAVPAPLPADAPRRLEDIVARARTREPSAPRPMPSPAAAPPPPPSPAPTAPPPGPTESEPGRLPPIAPAAPATEAIARGAERRGLPWLRRRRPPPPPPGTPTPASAAPRRRPPRRD